MNRFTVASIACFSLVVFSLILVGCVQEKQWPASPTPFVASAEPSAAASLTPTPTATRTPTPTATHTPTPSPSPSPSPSIAAPSCILTANPNTFVGPVGGVVLAAAFKNLPANVSSATMKCFTSDSGQSIAIGSQGGAFRSCDYPLAPIGGTTYEASASAGGASCTASLTNGYNASTGPVISSVAPSVTHANATINWITDVTCGSDKVEYGLTAAYGTNVTNSSALATTAHSMFLSGLSASTTYHYRVWSCSLSNGLCSGSADYSFATTATPSTTPSPSPSPSPTPSPSPSPSPSPTPSPSPEASPSPTP